MDTASRKIQFVPIKDLADLKFVVKDYQRGYKWEREHIRALLEDIDLHDQGKYCLQPLIVKSDNGIYELIDGQQRITSIYLLIYFLTDLKFWEIDYQTRTSTKDFLINRLNLLKESSERTGGEFCNANKKYDNVDIFHIYEVYHEITIWFSGKDEEFKNSFLDRMINLVHIIWFDVAEHMNDQAAEDIFLNLNAGKIPLTNSELIKALFILDLKRNSKSEWAKLKAFELANDWDRIENKLYDKSFWYFLCDRDYYNQLPTRIDLIIDLANGFVVNEPEKDSRRSYEKYERLYRDGKNLEWEEILKTFFKLEEWYEEKELYHYIGFLIVSRIENLHAILALSKNRNKESFKSSLISKIQNEFGKGKIENGKTIRVYDIDQLDYSVNRTNCENILLLFNIQYFLNEGSSNRFPFDLYKEEKWSVEHINPQNPREFKDIVSVMKWLGSFEKYFRDKQEEDDLRQRINATLGDFETVRDKSQKIGSVGLEVRQKFYDVVDDITSKLELHKIGNLCLLDKNTNSKLGNRNFLSKRSELIYLYYHSKSNNTFIPNGTKDVFTKNFSEHEGSITQEIFGMQDMEDYQLFIKKRLQPYYHEHEGN